MSRRLSPSLLLALSLAAPAAHAGAPEPAEAPDAGERVRQLVERAIQRNIKGLEYFASAAPPVGLTPTRLPAIVEGLPCVVEI